MLRHYTWVSWNALARHHPKALLFHSRAAPTDRAPPDRHREEDQMKAMAAGRGGGASRLYMYSVPVCTILCVL